MGELARFHLSHILVKQPFNRAKQGTFMVQAAAYLYGLLRGVQHLYLRHKGTLKTRSHHTGMEAHVKFVLPSILSMKKDVPSDVRACLYSLIARSP